MFHDNQSRGRNAQSDAGGDEVRGPQAGPDFDRGHGHRGGLRGTRDFLGRDFPGRGFGGRGPGGRGFDRMMARGPMVRRGDVRTAILALLVEEPMHGYQVIRLLNERSGGMWRVSAGSVYPTLQQLEDEGLVKGEQREGRNVYVLTDEGRIVAARSSGERAPWDMPGASDAADLRDLLSQLGAAVWQVSHVGGTDTVTRAGAVLLEARRSLYRLLAEDDGTKVPAPAATAPDASVEDGR